MKTLTLIAAAAFCSFSSLAQLSVGSTWYNTYNDQFNPTPHYSVSKDILVKDTVINGQQAFIYKGQQPENCLTTTSNIIRQDGKKIYHWSNDKKEFMLLYDFALNTGQSYELKTDFGTTKITIDSTSTIIKNGKTLKQQHVSSSNHINEIYGPFVENIGSMFYFFPRNGVCDPIHIMGVRCFEDASGTIHFTTEDCATISGMEELNMEKLTIYPNPASDFIKLTTSTNSADISYEIQDLNGRTLLSIKGNEDEQVDISTLPKGAYVVKGFDNTTNQSFSRKLIKL